MIVDSIEDFISETPLYELPLKRQFGRIFLKLEQFNASGSMKDRSALSMINAAERDGQLKPGGTIIESTSGNSGVALAMIAAARGYHFIAVVDTEASIDKLRMMKAFGSEIITESSMNGRDKLAKELAIQIENAVFLEQIHNPNNPQGYFSLAEEILRDLNGNEIDFLVGCVGTGGSLCGVARVLKLEWPSLQVIAIEPQGSVIFGVDEQAEKGIPYYQSGGTTPGAVIASNIDRNSINTSIKVSDVSAFTTMRFLAKQYGLFVGASGAGAIYATAHKLFTSFNNPVAVVIVGDGGNRYLEYDDTWLERKGFLCPLVNEQLSEIFITE
ncbi:hypothetical protein B4U84_28745 [Westiellopsis prolifica IICB1]|nr:hypothetical protein B4U84_28745 [Westiellopsis prolifica IICB1]